MEKNFSGGTSQQLSTPWLISNPPQDLMWIEYSWASLIWGLSGLFLSQTSVIVGKYIDILATCKSHNTLDKGLFLPFVNKRVGLKWRAGDILSQAKRFLANIRIHFLLVILGRPLQVGVVVPLSLPVSFSNLKCALFYKMWKPISLIRPTLTSLLCLVPGAVQGYGNEGFYFLRHGFHLKKLTG